MSALNNSLLCLKHPATLLSIGLLLMNDHILKGTVPSWLTGKLSDFAGLFFFPFVLAAALSVPLDRLRFPARRTGWLAFAITGTWFALIKASPWGNSVTEDLLARLLGVPVQIILDPTDLIALVVLWPAWRLWRRLEEMRPSVWAWLALGVASLASLATTPSPEYILYSEVTRVGTLDGVAYARYEVQRYGYGRSSVFAESDDGGRTWREVSTVPPGILPYESQRLLVCDPTDSRSCYRISGSDQIEQSDDGGKTWRVAWNTPRVRAKYLQRQKCSFDECVQPYHVDLYDMTFLSQNGSTTLIVAMGGEGVLVRTPKGDWQRYGVLNVKPMPYAAAGPGEASGAIPVETVQLWVVGALAALVLSILGWSLVLTKVRGTPASKRSVWALRPMLVSSALLVVSCLGWLGFLMMLGIWPDVRSNYGLVFLAILMCLLPLGVFILASNAFLTWRRVASLTLRPGFASAAAVLCLLTPIVVCQIGSTPLLLWGMWVIPVYEDGLRLSILFTIFAIILCLLGVLLASRQAMRPFTPS